MVFTSCEFKFKPNEDENDAKIEVTRYDRLESRYLTTGDFSALQQMNTGYPMETRTLIEKVLRIGNIDDPEINAKFLNFYQDTILQTLIADAEAEYANMEDINKELNEAFSKLKTMLPDIPIPMVYAQIGALDQSIIIGDNTIGISLDKYLGEDYPLYKKYYSAAQRKQMKRGYILPDCLSFYLLSIYSLPDFETCDQMKRDLHVGKVMWVVNNVLGRKVFNTNYIDMIDLYMKKNPNISIRTLLNDNDYSKFGSS